MNKFILCLISFAALGPLPTNAQQTLRQVITIDQIFALAEQNSKALRPGASAIDEARQAVKVAQDARLPEIQAALSLSFLGDGYLLDRDFSNGMTAPIPHFGNSFSLELSQPLYTAGAVTNAIAIARLQETNARTGQEASRNTVRFRLLGYYLDLYKQQNLLHVYEKNIEQTQQVLTDMRAKAEQGLILHNDITRYELLALTLERSRTQIQNTTTILNRQLTTSLGLPDNIAIMPDTSLLATTQPVAETAYWTSLAVENSPTLRQLSLAVQINERQQQIIRAERLPQLALVAANHLEGPITFEIPPVNKNFNYWYIGLGLKYRFSSLYKTKQSINRSRFSIQRAAEQYDDAKEQTELAIQADYIRYLEDYDQLNTQRKSVELANQNYALVRNLYRNDMALLTDILDAGNAQLAAEVQLANLQIDIVFYYFKLLYLSGTLSNY